MVDLLHTYLTQLGDAKPKIEGNTDSLTVNTDADQVNVSGQSSVVEGSKDSDISKSSVGDGSVRPKTNSGLGLGKSRNSGVLEVQKLQNIENKWGNWW